MFFITPRPPLSLLQVMTGPGLRVRKHHRAGKGNSGLRVLRYIEEEDILTWDSHKILGAAQHVLPMADVEVCTLWFPAPSPVNGLL